MCGIAGIYCKNKQNYVDLNELKTLSETIKHRGPDDSGLYLDGSVGLTHQRLSIIDISGGQQPMKCLQKNIIIVFNGEIYNYLELKEELIALGEVFETRSDTEVILKSYKQWGESCIQKFNGMWAFAICDLRGDEPYLFCSRDRMGIKPFYFIDFDDRIIFSSEIKSFKQINGFDLSPDYNMLWDALVYGPKAFGQTIYKGVKELGPGQTLSISNGAYKIDTYFNLANTFEDQSVTFDIEEIDWLLDDAVKIRLRSDVPMATINSGGLDSSLISSLASRSIDDLHTYSVAPERGKHGEVLQGDESSFADVIAKYLDSTHSTVRYNSHDFEKEFEKALFANDGTMFHPNSVPLKILFEKIKKDGITVVLGGEGADEVFRGYYSNKILQVLNFSGNWAGRKILALKYRDRGHIVNFDNDPSRVVPFIRNNTFSPKKASSVLGIKGDICEERGMILDKMNKLNPENAIAFCEQSTYLAGLLQRADRMSMAHAVELRVPFLDHRLVIALNRIKHSSKSGTWKYQEKKILKEISKKYLPESTIKRKKYGFASPLKQHRNFLVSKTGKINFPTSKLSESELWIINALLPHH